MKWLIWVVAIFILLIINGGVFSSFYFLPFLPGLVVVLNGIILALEDKTDWLALTIVSGVLLDFASGLPDGIMLLSLLGASGCVYAIIYWWLNREYNWVILFISTAVLTLLYFVFVVGLAWLFSLVGLESTADSGFLLTRKVLWYIVINIILTYPVYLYYLLIKFVILRLNKKKRYESV
jgi:hypothetical protein